MNQFVKKFVFDHPGLIPATVSKILYQNSYTLLIQYYQFKGLDFDIILHNKGVFIQHA